MNPISNPTPLFGDYNQFASSDDDHVDKAFYYPSTNKVLEEDEKKIALTQRYVDPPNSDSTFFGENNKEMSGKAVPDCLLSFVDLSGSVKYNESWATTTEKSFPSQPVPIQNSTGKAIPPSKEHSIEDYIEKNGGQKEYGGTLSKFVQRFRKEPPLARSERQKEGKKKDFWWLHSPKEIKSSTPNSINSSYPSLDLDSISFSPSTEDQLSSGNVDNKKSQIQPRLLYNEESDSGMSRMQIRTEKLLQLSENVVKDTLSSSSNVSQNPYSKKMDSFRPKYSVEQNSSSYTTAISKRPSPDEHDKNRDAFHKLRKPLKPEDDILYQWRLSHKMDSAVKAVEPNPFLERRGDENVDSDATDRVQKVNNTTAKDKKLSKKDLKPKSLKKPKTEGNPSSKEVKNNDTHSEGSFSESRSNTSDSDDSAAKQNVTASLKQKSKSPKISGRNSKQSNCRCNNSSPLSFCKKLLNNQQQHQCQAQSQSQICHCNAHEVCHHIPSYVHVYDFTSCVQINKQSGEGICRCSSKESKEVDKDRIEKDEVHPARYDKTKVMQNNDQNKAKSLDERKKTSGREKTEMRHEDHAGINPVINQVISDHLFIDSTLDSSELQRTDDEAPKQNVNGYKADLFDDDSSSGDEFASDEILHELRTRRRNIKIEQRKVDERLEQMKS